jgi:hypothetical protein
MWLNQHPAPGLGDLLPGFFVVPQNPMASTTYVPRIGDILPGSFPVPQNPIKDYMSGRLNLIAREPGVQGKINGKPAGVSGCSGGSCGCGGSCGGGLSGVGEDFAVIQADITAGDYGKVLTDTILGIPLCGFGVGLALLMFAGGEQHSYVGRGRRAARAAARAW